MLASRWELVRGAIQHPQKRAVGALTTRPVGRRRLATWALLLSAAAFYAAFIARTSFDVAGERYFTLFDDSMISMRYARNLVEGHGLVWNPGASPVEGYSNLLWTVLMGVLHVLPGPDSQTSVLVMVTGAGLLIGTALVVRRIALALAPDRTGAATAAMALTALYYPLVFWTLRGMEVGLVAFLIASAVLLVLLLRDRFDPARLWMLAIALGLGVLTRDDVLVPAIVIAGFALLTAEPAQRRRIGITLAAVVGGALLAHTAFRLAYYGEPLPNTYYLKLEGIPLRTRLERGVDALAFTAITHLYAPLVLGGVYVVATRRTADVGVRLLAAVFIALCAYSVYVGGDAWEDMEYANRYVAAGVPLLITLATLSIAWLVDLGASARRRVCWGLAAAMAAAGAAMAWAPLSRAALEIAPGQPGLHDSRTVIALCAAAAFAALPIPLGWRDRRGHAVHSDVSSRASIAVLAMVLLVATSGWAVQTWGRDNAAGFDVDTLFAHYGLVLQDHTAPGTRVAVTLAGNISYFSDRPIIDLLGKMDPAVAHTPPKPVAFRPGHNKWDYGHSIGALRPPIAARLWFPTAADVCAMDGWGYDEIAPGAYVHRDASGIDRESLRAELQALLLRPRGVDAPEPCV